MFDHMCAASGGILAYGDIVQGRRDPLPQASVQSDNYKRGRQPTFCESGCSRFAQTGKYSTSGDSVPAGVVYDLKIQRQRVQGCRTV